MKIRIYEDSVEKRISNKTGNEYSVQHFYAYLPGKHHPSGYEMFCRDDGFPPGVYECDLEKSVRANASQLEFGELVMELIPEKKQPQPSKPAGSAE